MTLEFKKLTFGSLDELRPYFIENECRICDCTRGGTFLWRDYHDTEYAVENGVLYLKVAYPEPAFAPPRGKAANRGSYDRILGYCSDNGMRPRLCSVSEVVLEGILKIFPGSEVRTDRAWSDYLYLSGDLINLSGRRYAGQRNHINRFVKEHPGWSFESVTATGLPAAGAFIEEYARESFKDSPAYIEGNRKALEALHNLEYYGLVCGVLLVGEVVVGVSIGERSGDTLYIHVEKADVSFHGSYPMLMNQFARSFAAEGIAYINREEDDGVDGLRASKLSYHPVELLAKSVVELK